MKKLSNEEKCLFYEIAQKMGYKDINFIECLFALYEKQSVCFHFIKYVIEGESNIKKTTRIKDLQTAYEAIKNLKYNDARIDFIF